MILFCIPFAGGGEEAFHGWPAQLLPAAEVRPAALPGRGSRFGQPLLRRMDDLVVELSRQCETWAGQRLCILGFSFGAFVAYALTLHLERLGRGPERLFVGGNRAPFLPHQTLRHLLPDNELVAQLAALGGTDDQVLRNPDIMRILTPILRADFEVAETYRCTREPVRCPLSIFGGDQDNFVPFQDLEAWRSLTFSSATLRTYPGSHFILQSHRERLCADIAADLALDELDPRPLLREEDAYA
jgi:surfactin synthase thioesterase subunit